MPADDDDEGKWLVNQGNAKAELEEYEAAIEDYTEAIELDPQNVDAYFNRGVTRADLGRYEAAIEDYSRAIDADPEDVPALLNRAEMYIVTGDFERALEDSRTADSLTDSPDRRAESLLLEVIAMICRDEAAETVEQEYRSVCEESFTVSWDFEHKDSWLERTDIATEKRARLAELIDLLREHRDVE
jgi:tetratricopeptide (TPR) repeat protein